MQEGWTRGVGLKIHQLPFNPVASNNSFGTVRVQTTLSDVPILIATWFIKLSLGNYLCTKHVVIPETLPKKPVCQVAHSTSRIR